MSLLWEPTLLFLSWKWKLSLIYTIGCQLGFRLRLGLDCDVWVGTVMSFILFTIIHACFLKKHWYTLIPCRSLIFSVWANTRSNSCSCGIHLFESNGKFFSFWPKSFTTCCMFLFFFFFFLAITNTYFILNAPLSFRKVICLSFLNFTF